MLEKVKKELEELRSARKKAVEIQEEIIPLCAQAIRDIQKEEYKEAEKKLKKIEERIKKCELVLKKYPEIVDSLIGIVYQEFAELSIFLSYLKEKKLPKLNIPAKYYLLGLGDALGELKRVCLELLAENKLKEAEKLEKEIEDLYFEFSKHVYPNSVVPGLKRKQDVARRILDDLHNLILSHKLTRP